VKPTALLVEDEFLLREATRDDLEELGLSVVCARDCDEGWDLLNTADEIQVLVTDIRTPGQRDGWVLAGQARELRPTLCVIYVSGYSADQPQPVPGAIFLKKPYRFQELRAALVDLGVL
jgi:CheY-like chemotaxis protein